MATENEIHLSAQSEDVTSGGFYTNGVAQPEGNSLANSDLGASVSAAEQALGGNFSIKSAGAKNGGGTVIVNSAAASGGSVAQGLHIVNPNSWNVGNNAKIGVIPSGSALLVQRGGTAQSTDLDVGGTMTVQSGGLSINTVIHNQTTGDLNPPDATTRLGGTMVVNAGATAVSTWLFRMGTEIVSGVENNPWVAGGKVIIASGGVASGGSYGENLPVGQIPNQVNTVLSGGTMLNPQLYTIKNGNVVNGTVQLDDGASLTLGPNAGGMVLIGSGAVNGGVVLGGLDTLGNGTQVYDTVLTGFSPGNEAPTYNSAAESWEGGDSDGVVLKGLSRSDITAVYNEGSNLSKVPDSLKSYLTGDNAGNYALIQTKSGGWLVMHIPGIGANGAIGLTPDGSIAFEYCYLEGTRILTPEGYRLIETLKPQDHVMVAEGDGTQKGRSLPLKWVGKKRVWIEPEADSLNLPDEESYSVKISKGAFSENVPERDLWVTPEHCFLFNGKFIPIRMLVNGKTIAYDYDRLHYTYFHLETESHSILIAEGALGESYLDTGNRAGFVAVLEPHREGNAVVFCMPPRTSLPSLERSWDDAAAPLDVSCDFAEPLWHRLAKHAGQDHFEGRAISKDPQIKLVWEENGQQKSVSFASKEEVEGGMSYLFDVSKLAGISQFSIASRTSRPCDIVGPFLDDRRHLGILVQKIYLLGKEGERCEVKGWSDSPEAEGWNNVENGILRWTAGKALVELPQEMMEKAEKCVIEVIAGGPYLALSETPERQAA
ncbi:Hint domain-containing protein [Acetobacteraceae bacterium]|nr:Hint domain-containing protein [Acetobacteraceae bacterium]